MWWCDATIYQVYPCSFQDSDCDGVGDLEGIRRRLDHIADLGADALWLSPIYPSPLADSDYTAVAPEYGTLADLDRLVADAHGRGLRVLMDLVPCHISIEHPWFRAHPEWAGRVSRRASFLGSQLVHESLGGRHRPRAERARRGLQGEAGRGRRRPLPQRGAGLASRRGPR